MEELILHPNVSVGEFIVGDNVENYLYREHKVEKVGDNMPYDAYIFDDIGVVLWTEPDGEIDIITCSLNCVWEGNNIIGMNFDDFLLIYEDEAGSPEFLEAKEWVGGLEMLVYEYEDLGFQLMVIMGTIISVVIL